MSLRDAWETRAPDWVRWARSPELDNDFWTFHLPEFLRLLPAPGRLTVDVGCGEGRLGRVLARSGHHVVGIDASMTSALAAASHPEAHPVVVADATRLPLPDAAADLAVAFMSLHDFDDLPAAVSEAARILVPGGRFCIALLHPLASVRMVDGYADERRYEFTVERAGLRMTYEGTHRPLSAYFGALETAGLVVEAVREPAEVRPDGSRHVHFLQPPGPPAGSSTVMRIAVLSDVHGTCGRSRPSSTTSGGRAPTWWCTRATWRSTGRGRPRWSTASASSAGPAPTATPMRCCGPVDGDWRPSYLLVDGGQVRVRRVRHDLAAQIAELRASTYPSRSWLIKVHQRAASVRPFELDAAP